MIRCGTSGFSYDDWVGHFYPEGLARRDMLTHYAQHFNCVEVNFTYYRMPDARTFERMADKTPPDFHFVVKANSEMTHERRREPEVFEMFAAALQPLIDRGQFGCVLAQFPYSFRATRENVGYLRWFEEAIGSLPTVVEFRNARWVMPGTYKFLREHGFGYCCVDEPDLEGLMPREAVATSRLGYVRFHGRNAAKWWEHDEAWERYDYLYDEDELSEWVPKVRELEAQTDDLYLFFNNHYQAKAVQNAQMFQTLLGLED
jgi:uncharacterized protein YecE (DUF72 family)